MLKFIKPPLNLDEKLKLLKSRELVINDEEKAKQYLQHIGYFRLTGYFKYFQNKETNNFFEGIDFQKIIDLYIFDRKLRLLTLDAIEKIEISLKANVNDYLSKEFGVFWYKGERLFHLEYDKYNEIYNDFIEIKIPQIIERKSIFVKAYFEKYDEEDLPSWMLFEELTIGEVVNIYKILKKEYKEKITKNYNVNFIDFGTWMALIKKIRNIVAHHERLWNNEYNVRLKLNDKIFGDKFQKKSSNGKIEAVSNYYNFSLIIHYLLKQINLNLGWLDDLEALFEEYRNVPKESMGFQKDWKINFE